MDLAQVADELYGLAPGEFRAARDERSGQARAAGDRELAAAIAKLRRPTVSAWLVNQLAREAGDGLDHLDELGAALREAQQALAGDRLRELSGERRAQLRTLTQHAKRLAAGAGQPFSAQTEREIKATLEAALADPAAAAAVRSGRLAHALSHVGLGDPDPAPGTRPRLVHSATGPGAGRGAAAQRAAGPDRGGLRGVPGTAPRAGAPTARRQPREVTAARQAAREAAAAAQQAAREAAAAERHARDVAAAERDVQEAQAQAEAASAAMDQAERRVRDARSGRRAARGLVEQLEQRLVAAQADEARAIREVRDAQRGREAAARAVTTAQRQVLRARARLGKLG